MEALNENESPNKNIAIGDALYKHFRSKISNKELLKSNGFGFRQNSYIDSFGMGNKKGILDNKIPGRKEYALRGQNITYVFGFLRPGIVSHMTGEKNQSREELIKYLQNEVDKIANQYNVNIKIGNTSSNTRYTWGADAVVYTINRID